MIVKAWNNGDHHISGAGYGIKVEIKDRDRFSQRSWKTVFVSLPGGSEEIEINVAKPSFWNDTCRELISKEIGTWLIKNGYAPWTHQRPPRFQLSPTYDNHFELNLLS